MPKLQKTLKSFVKEENLTSKLYAKMGYIYQIMEGKKIIETKESKYTDFNAFYGALNQSNKQMAILGKRERYHWKK